MLIVQTVETGSCGTRYNNDQRNNWTAKTKMLAAVSFFPVESPFLDVPTA